MHDLTAYNRRVWLAEPGHFELAARRVLSFKSCPSARQMAKARARWRDDAAAVVERATLCGAGIDLSDVPAEQHAAAPGSPSIRAVKGKIAVIPIYGMVDQRYTPEMEKAGGTPLDYVGMSLDRCLASADIGAVVLDMDTPGGSPSGCGELSDKIFAARDQKPVYAICNSMACSAGCWLATAASAYVCTPGGLTANIGAYTMHIDRSGEMEQQGLAVTLISAGKYKVEGNPYEPIGDEAKDDIQSQINYTYDRFVAAVARNRGVAASVVKSDYGQGRVLNATQAVACGLCDRTMTLEQLLSRLVGAPAGGGQAKAQAAVAAASMQVLRLRQAHRRRQEMAGGVG